jgi:Arc/MetJ-type ribon-helix-helix transcriptional regulator
MFAMTIYLRAGLEELIQQDIQRGPYHTVEEFLEHAVRLLHEQEVWFASHRLKIAEQVEQGWNAATRGELAGDVQVKSNMQEKKRASPLPM